MCIIEAWMICYKFASNCLPENMLHAKRVIKLDLVSVPLISAKERMTVELITICTYVEGMRRNKGFRREAKAFASTWMCFEQQTKAEI